MSIRLLAAAMFALLGQTQPKMHHHKPVIKPANEAIQAIRAVKLHAPTKASRTLGQHFAALEQAAKNNNSPIANGWSAARSGKMWIVTLISSSDSQSDNTAKWRVKLKPISVTPVNAVAKKYETDLRGTDMQR